MSRQLKSPFSKGDLYLRGDLTLATTEKSPPAPLYKGGISFTDKL
jgi:hypothetical protein